jgi:Concanavalin A-like lectin/glucanases superfamily
MFFFAEPDPILHVTASLKAYIEPTTPTGSYITLLNGAKISSSSGVDSFYFDGTNDYAQLTASLNGITTRAFTISFWAKLPYNNTGTIRTLFSNKIFRSYVINGGEWKIYDGFHALAINGQIEAEISQFRPQGQISYDQGSQVDRTSVAREGRVDDGQWHNIVICSYGGEPYSSGYFGQDVKIYLDKKPSTGQGSGTANPSIWSHYNTLTLGAGPIPTYANFSGHCAAIQIYDRRLSTAEIEQNYNAFKTRFGR